MQERHVKVPTADGLMTTFIAQPDGPGPFAAVIMYHFIGGVTDAMRHTARRVAEAGYCCALPDLYYRLGGLTFDVDNKNPVALEIRGIARGSVAGNPAKVVEDTRALISHLDAEPAIRRGPKGCIGYCLGGRLAFVVAGELPDQIKATATLHGTALYAEDPAAPYHWANRIQGELYCGMAEEDFSMSAAAIEKLELALRDTCRAKWQVETHPGTHHGFAIPGRLFNRQANEAAWDSIFAMFGRQLAG